MLSTMSIDASVHTGQFFPFLVASFSLVNACRSTVLSPVHIRSNRTDVLAPDVLSIPLGRSQHRLQRVRPDLQRLPLRQPYASLPYEHVDHKPRTRLPVKDAEEHIGSN
jgi:hypothetical protein